MIQGARMRYRFFLVASALAAAVLLLPASLQRAAAKGSITIVAAENFYGDVAAQIAGNGVHVMSILNNPDQDPHLFEASASVARAISAAQVVVYSGIDYDPWMEKLLRAARNPQRKVIVVAELIGKKPGDNPHVWYDLVAIKAFAKSLTDDLVAVDPAHAAAYRSRLTQFQRSLLPISAKIKQLRTRLAGTPVTATEPVFGYMLDALGMVSRNQKFQLAVMNNTEPSASDVAGFESDLKHHRVRLLIYNSQASDPVAERMLKLAKESQVPVVGATETEPPGKSYQVWIAGELDAIARAVVQGRVQSQ
ncbi:MAG: cation ABC transporter substrate-binding protein [Beijerinckiaceae bacterium]|nr:MAG: cation ABC transporter substrate-binding protein [Beijerinckiaceae bacterium]